MTPRRPSIPPASVRLAGTLSDLGRASRDAYVPGEEVGAIAAVLRRALVDMGANLEQIARLDDVRE